MVKVLNYDVHQSHCCKHHCKYAEENCPVVNGKIKAEYECECKKQHSYKVLKSSYSIGHINDAVLNQFSLNIEKYLNDGWVLAGGIATGVSNGNEHFLYQAITKTND